MNFKKAEDEQRKLSSKIILKDDFSGITLIGGAEVCSIGPRMAACVVVCDASTMEIKEKAFAAGMVAAKYLPEFRAYREGPLLGQALSSLDTKPDVLLFSGEGIMHPRRCGLASHIGVMLDIPSIGVSTEAWFGEVKGNDVLVGGEQVAMLVKTRDHANPLAVSPGHRISLQKAVEIVRKCIREPHKMPEPIHLAHKHAKKYLQGKEKEENLHP